ncbi:MAG: periplasmic protein TonB [Acidobacteriota bacterium]|jgi:TonB family protein|nr:periplasmic protein TonB [Acidobacteriota bacterium]
MNIYRRFIFLLLVFISSSISSLPQQSKLGEPPAIGKNTLGDWKEFSSTDGGFKILFPKTPKESTGSINVGKLVVKTYTYSVLDDATYAVMYFDAPHTVDDPKINGELLVGMRNFILAELKGKLLSESPISFDNNPGRLLEISLPKGGIARAMIIVAGQRIYRITVVPAKRISADEDSFAKATSIKYLESFKLTTIDRSTEGEVDRYLREHPELAQREFASDSNAASGGILNGKALSLPFPEYPLLASGVHAAGTVIVKVIIDEEGKVIAAQAVGGHPLLQQSAENAARKARFSPTLENGKPVKVYGKVTYNFVAR